VRPVITFVIAASGLKYVGVGATALGWILCAILLGGSALWLTAKKPWRKGRLAVDLAQSDADALAQSEADALAVEERIWPAG
jgi:hypothetical protein